MKNIGPEAWPEDASIRCIKGVYKDAYESLNQGSVEKVKIYL